MSEVDDDSERLVCFCHCVSYRQLVEAIRQGATTLQNLREKTRASTGCGGCTWEVEEILGLNVASGSGKGRDSNT
ncbi:MAG: (2Fe-2S)-binding protein [Oligoflexia bacterium]|nr:(2Fe-2S)-binding protein [Oligoflexia bacterium]